MYFDFTPDVWCIKCDKSSYSFLPLHTKTTNPVTAFYHYIQKRQIQLQLSTITYKNDKSSYSFLPLHTKTTNPVTAFYHYIQKRQKQFCFCNRIRSWLDQILIATNNKPHKYPGQSVSVTSDLMTNKSSCFVTAVSPVPRVCRDKRQKLLTWKVSS